MYIKEDRYPSKNNALEEYYKLKKQLELTRDEYYALGFNKPYKVLSSGTCKQFIKEYLKDTERSQKEIAEEIGINRTTLSRLMTDGELGYNSLGLITMFLIEKGYVKWT